MKPPVEVPRQFTYTRTVSATVDYLLFLPEGYENNSKKKWPLMLFLHGAGERGDDIWKVATHGPPRLATNHFKLPFIIVSPLCPAGKTWSSDQLLALLDHVEANYQVDTTRVYLTGLSMGGYGTWTLGLSHPERFAAIAPICGGGESLGPLLASGEKAKAIASLGIWAFHGAKDPVVPLAESERMIEISKRAGVKDVKLTVYPQAGHNAWTETYENPELYKWFLKHVRKGESGSK